MPKDFFVIGALEFVINVYLFINVKTGYRQYGKRVK